MIMYAHLHPSSQATLFTLIPGRGFRSNINIPLKDLRPDIAALLQVKSRLCGGVANVYLNNEGNIIDTPETLP